MYLSVNFSTSNKFEGGIKEAIRHTQRLHAILIQPILRDLFAIHYRDIIYNLCQDMCTYSQLKKQHYV